MPHRGVFSTALCACLKTPAHTSRICISEKHFTHPETRNASSSAYLIISEQIRRTQKVMFLAGIACDDRSFHFFFVRSNAHNDAALSTPYTILSKQQHHIESVISWCDAIRCSNERIYLRWWFDQVLVCANVCTYFCCSGKFTLSSNITPIELNTVLHWISLRKFPRSRFSAHLIRDSFRFNYIKAISQCFSRPKLFLLFPRWGTKMNGKELSRFKIIAQIEPKLIN